MGFLAFKGTSSTLSDSYIEKKGFRNSAPLGSVDFDLGLGPEIESKSYAFVLIYTSNFPSVWCCEQPLASLFSKDLALKVNVNMTKKKGPFFSHMGMAISALGLQQCSILALTPQDPPRGNAVFSLACLGAKVPGSPTLSALGDSL